MTTIKTNSNKEYSIRMGLSFLFIITMLNGAYGNAGELKPALEPKAEVYDLCFSPAGDCDDKIIQFIHSSEQTLDVAIYTLTHQGIFKAIQRAAERGVKVRLILDREQLQTSPISVDDMRKRGLEFKVSSVEGIMHHKFTIVDGVKIETGSYNYTYSATNKNAENQLYIQSPKLVGEYQKNFDTLWQSGN